MKHNAFLSICTYLLICSTSSYLPCQENDTPPQIAKQATPNLTTALPTTWIRDQSISLQTPTHTSPKLLQYDIATGSLAISSEDTKNRAEITYIGYFAKKPEKNRPVAFCFNGGPGSSSVWLHLGGLGPKKITLPEASWPHSTAELIDNPYTLLQQADLIFIDPVGTGFSKAIDGSDDKKFFGVDEDIDSLAHFLKKFLTKFQLWNRPKLLIGESYGALRITGLASELMNKYFINLHGLALISGTVDLRDIESVDTSDYASVIPIPTFAATAHYFGILAPEELEKPLPDFLSEVEAFCINELIPALFVGDFLTQKTSLQIAEKMSRYTGLPEEFILEQKLRIAPDVYAKKIFQKDGLVLGRFDTRYKGHNVIGLESIWFDPSLYAVAPAFTSAMNQYLNTLLHPEDDGQSYIILSSEAQSWNWGRKNNGPGLGFTNTILDARLAITNNPTMKIFVASGIYDLALPYLGQEISMYRLLLPKALKENITIKKYKGGHMMYLNENSLQKLCSDLSLFISDCTKTSL